MSLMKKKLRYEECIGLSAEKLDFDIYTLSNLKEYYLPTKFLTVKGKSKLMQLICLRLA